MLGKVNFSNLTMKDLLSKDDLENLKDLHQYLKCSRCGELMIEPKMCITCNKNFCNKCQGFSCNHPTQISRHLKSVLENCKFKCRCLSKGYSWDSWYFF
jgi:uncharacterized C2H2 Zn-finger protein